MATKVSLLILNNTPKKYTNYYESIYRSSPIVLNESNFDMYPTMFSTIIVPDLELLFRGTPGIQECATYTHAGHPDAGSTNGVCLILC